MKNEISAILKRIENRSIRDTLRAMWIFFRIKLFSIISSDRFYWDWWVKREHINRGYVPSIYQFLTLNKGKEALDLGSGNGYYAEILRDNGYNVTCSDRSQLALKILWRKGFGTKEIDISKPFDVSHYDVVSCMGVLHHMTNDNDVINALKNMEKSKFLIIGVRDIKDGKDNYKFKQRPVSFYSDIIGGNVIGTDEYVSLIIKDNRRCK